ncbi:MAG: hypothetical protein B7Z15_15735 [Rhizobiales bacterium 32-66-8]|nr:MAG: hypothetical protein B7Z15_15735 [Rhizobiales bacterium 32-66-8]
MNKIVRQHYPVDKLPEDLRAGLPAGQSVTVTLESESAPQTEHFDTKVADLLRNPKPMTFNQIRVLVGARNVSPDEAVARIRTLRDEWD